MKHCSLQRRWLHRNDLNMLSLPYRAWVPLNPFSSHSPLGGILQSHAVEGRGEKSPRLIATAPSPSSKCHDKLVFDLR